MSSEAARRKKKLVGKNSWFRQDNKTKEQEVSTENNENRGGSASGNPMLATPIPRSNCGGDKTCMKRATVDAEKQENGGESAPGNPMLTPQNPVMDQKDSLKRKRSRCPEKRRWKALR